MKFNTKSIHAGQKPEKSTGSMIIPIYQTSTYKQEGINIHSGFEYSRSGNPTRQALEENIAALENGKYGLAFGSGLAAEHAILSTLKPGDHVVAAEDMYGGTYRLFEQVFKQFGIQFSYVQGKISDFRDATQENTRLYWIESPTNPLLRITDIRAIAESAHEQNIRVVVDNTFASPYFQLPLDLGADLVVHSATKYLGGHSDLVAGVLVLNDQDWYTEIKFIQNAAGAIPGPFDCWLMLRGIKTLGIRMKQHAENAQRIAEYLETHPLISGVNYPGLVSNPYHELAKKQMSGFGGMISFRLKGANKDEINAFFKKLQIISLAESLGGVESLISYPAAMTHGAVPEEQRKKIGVTDDLVRLSVGIEDIEDLIGDLTNALEDF